MTGVTGLSELVAAGPELRPTYISTDLGGLDAPQPLPEVSEDAVSLGGWQARVSNGALEMSGSGETDDWWRVVAVAAWRHLDAVGKPVATNGAAPPE
jgi:hypothetical protein